MKIPHHDQDYCSHKTWKAGTIRSEPIKVVTTDALQVPASASRLLRSKQRECRAVARLFQSLGDASRFKMLICYSKTVFYGYDVAGQAGNEDTHEGGSEDKTKTNGEDLLATRRIKMSGSQVCLW